MKTAGSVALSNAVAKHGDMTKLAEKLGVLPNMVSRWASGERTPRMPMLVRLEKELAIAVRSWGEAPAAESPASNGNGAPAATGTDDTKAEH